MSLFKNISLQEFLEGAWHTFLRYPLVLLSAITGTIAAIVKVEIPYEQLSKYEYLNKLIIVSAIGLILFFTLELLVAKYKLRFAKRVMLCVSGLIFLIIYYIFLPAKLQEKHQIRLFLLALALHLAAAYAMFFNRREENAFWQFNKALFLRILTSALYSAVLFVGLALAILAIDNLFDVDIDSDRYGQLWLLLVGIFNTWFFLAGVPTDVRQLEEDTQYPKSLKVFTQFVLLPLVTLYLVILYVYFGKIVVQWAWPKGWVSVLVLCFSVAGILSLLLIHPIRHQTGNTWIRTFSKWFYRALFPLIILLMLAIWRRVSEYGITEARYMVMALAFWLFCTALYFLLSAQKNIKFIPVTLSLVALLAAYGPFNAFQVSERSQVSRLQTILQNNKVLVNGSIVKANPKVPFKVEQEVSSIMYYLERMHGFESIKPWFKTDLDSLLVQHADSLQPHRIYDYNRTALVMDEMGLTYGLYPIANQNLVYFNVKEEPQKVWNVSGYDYMMEVYFTADRNFKNPNAPNPMKYKLGTDSLFVTYLPATEQLQVILGDDEATYTLDQFYRQLLKEPTREMPQNQLMIQLESAGFEAALQVQHLSVNRKKASYTLENLSGRLLIRKKK